MRGVNKMDYNGNTYNVMGKGDTARKHPHPKGRAFSPNAYQTQP